MTVVSSYTIATVLSLQTLCACVIFTFGQYIYKFYLQTYPFDITNSTASFINNNASSKCAKSNISLQDGAQSWAQQQSADLFFWINVWSCCPIIIMTYILGLYTPKLGRRFVLILPMLGGAVQLSVWLSIIYLHLPEYWWYIAAFVVGLSGSDNVRSRDLGFISSYLSWRFFL
jgi:MFS family permease